MTFIRQTLYIQLLILSFFISKNSFALESLSYSGRLVNTNGSPVAGPVNLKVELSYTNAPSTILCSQTISNVALTNGVFHLKVDLDCGTDSLTEVLAAVPNGEAASLRVVDLSHSKTYGFQAIHAVPFSNTAEVAKQIVQMGAGPGQVLQWNNTSKKWEPGTITVSGGTVTNVSVNAPLTITNPASTPSITLPQANTTTNGYISSTDWNTFNNKQPSITAGTTAQYYRGDKSWQTLDTSVVPENVANLYFTNARALGVPLTGFNVSPGTITSSDTVLSAFEKTQGQINSIGAAGNNYLVKNSSDSITGAVNVGVTGALTITNSPALPTDAANKQYVDTKLNLTGGTLSGDLNVDTQLKLKGATNYVTVKAHATSGTYNFILPQTAGTSGYVLQTDGSGNTSWVTPSIGSSNIADGSIVDADINASAAIAQSKIANLTSDLSTINTSISGINTTLSGLTTTSVSEGTNKYYTDTRAIGAPLTGFAAGTDTAIVAADTTLQAFEKSQGQINNRVKKNGDTMSGILTLDSDLKIKGGSNYVTLKGHATSATYNFIFPQTAGTSGYVLSTDGTGNLSWINPSSVTAGAGTVDSSSIANGSIVDADVNASAAIAQSKIANLTSDLAGKEPTITAGTASQYWKGNKTWSSLQTDVQALVLSSFATGANSSLANTDSVSGAFGKVQGQIDAINTAIAGKEANLAAGSTAQFYRGDKTWQTLNGGAVANTPAGTIAATSVQSALNELDSEKQDKLTSTSVVDNRELRFYELPGNGTFYSSIKSPDDLAANINYTLPVTAPTAGQVLSSNASGVMSWISIPSAPVTTVFGRSGAVVAANGDYTASQVTNVPAGSIAATDMQAALNELATEKEPALTNPSDTTKYYRGDKTWSTFATDAINSVLSTFAVGTGTKPAVTNTDSVVGAFGKVQKTLNDINGDYVSKSANNTVTGSFNISGITSFIQVPTPSGAVVNEATNVQYVQNYVGGFGQWTKTGSDIYNNTGFVGVGTTAPARRLDVVAPSGSTSPMAIRTNDFASGTTGSALFVDFGAASGNTFTKIGAASAGGSATANLVLQASGGNVGINTTTPNATLDVNGTIRVQQICDSTGANCKTVSSGWGNVAAASMVANWPDAIVCDDGTDRSIMYHDTRENSSNLEYYSKPSASHQLRFNATTGAWYDNTAFTGNSVCTGKSINTLISEGRTFGLLGGGVDWTPNGANVYRSGGNVGIGTSNPGSLLTLSNNAGNASSTFGGGTTQLELRGSTANFSEPKMIFTEQGNVVASIAAKNQGSANGSLIFLTNNTPNTTNGDTERMRITQTGNVGIGTTAPSAKLDVAGDIKATGGGTIGVTKVNGTFGNTTLNITNGTWTYVGDFITLPAGSWVVYYENFYDHDGTTQFSFNSYNHPFISTNTSNTGAISQGNLNACSANYCPIKNTYQVTLASSTTLYIVHLVSGYSGSYVRIRNWGNFYALKVN